MNTLAVRRWTLALIAVVIAAALCGYFAAQVAQLRDIGRASGWMLLGSIIFLALYNLRKKLTLFPALLPARLWLQAHIYVGLVTIVVFGWHISGRVPRGPLEVALGLTYGLTVLSGILGLIACRVIPGRLLLRGEPVLYERIPMFRRQIRGEAEALVLKTVQNGGATTLAEFYQSEVAEYFGGPRHRWTHLAQSTRPLVRILARMEAAGRYFNEAERSALESLKQMVKAKDALDYYHAMQGILRGWLFVHIPLTYLLLLLAAAHVVAVRAYSGAL